MSKSGNDLILATGNSDQITLQNWYSGTTNHSVANLQLVLDAGTYNASSSDPLLNQQVQDFDFAALAQAFDQALAANPTLTAWSLTDSLLSAHLAGSDTAALGGDLAYQYNLNGTLGRYRPGFRADGDQRCQFRCVRPAVASAGGFADRHGAAGLNG